MNCSTHILYALLAVALALLPGVLSGADSSGAPATAPATRRAAAIRQVPASGPVAPIVLTHDWPSYLGPSGNFSESSNARLLDDLNNARLVWESQEQRMGYGKQPEGPYPRLYPQFGDLPPGGAATPILVGGLLLHAHFIPSGEVWAKDIESALKPEEFVKQRWLVAADDAMIAIDAKTGKTAWKQVFSGKGLNIPNIKYAGWGLTPAADDKGRVFMVGTTGRVYAMEVASGKVLWETTVGDRHEALEKLKTQCISEQRLAAARRKLIFNMLGGLIVVEGVLLSPDLDKGGLLGFDTRDGRTLWHIPGPVTSGHNLPCPVTVAGHVYVATVNNVGDLRLIDPKSGQVLWKHALKSQHFTQPVFTGQHLLVFDPHPTYHRTDPGSMARQQALGEVKRYGLLAAYALTDTGATRAWSLPNDHVHELHMDGGPTRRVVARDGVVYYLNWNGGEQQRRHLVIIRDADGKLLSDQQVEESHLYLWGDRLVLPNDIQHRPAPWRPEIWRLFTLDPAGPKPLGKPWLVNTQEQFVHIGDSGYEVPILEVFADGLMYCRVMGGFRCYDLRRPTSAQLNEARNATSR